MSNFLNMYKNLEELLEAKYEKKQQRRSSSVVMEYLQDPESEPVRQRLDLIREIRNLMTHNPDVDGSPVVAPAQAIVNSLADIIEFVKRPPTAEYIMTPEKSVLKTHANERVLLLMRAMEKRGFSHVPVMENGRVKGVFSVNTIFTYVIREDLPMPDEKTTVGALSDSLPVERHRGEKYAFVAPDTSLFEIKTMFDRGSEKNKRLVAIFVTSDGWSDGLLMGMITPWDALENRQGFDEMQNVVKVHERDKEKTEGRTEGTRFS